MSSSGTFGVVRMDCPALDCRKSGFDIATFVERVRVDVDLDVILVTDVERAVDDFGRRSPVFVNLETTCPGLDDVAYGLLARIVALAGEAKVERNAIRRRHHVLHVELGGRASRRFRTVCRTRAAADEGGDTVGNRLFPDLRTDEMDMHVERSGGDDVFLSRDGLASECTKVDNPPLCSTRQSCLRSHRPYNPDCQPCQSRQSSHS
jgi:hypothetical protein